MTRILAIGLLCLALSGCVPDRSAIASASALPGYQAGARLVLAQAAKYPLSDAQKAAIKKLDSEAFAKVVTINGAELQKAVDLHEQVQGL